MKIRFVLYKFSKGEHEPESMVFANSWVDVEKYIKSGYHRGGLTQQAVETIKLLEYNSYFKEEVRTFREKHGIPENIDYLAFRKDPVLSLRKYKDIKDNCEDDIYENSAVDRNNYYVNPMLHQLIEIYNIAEKYNVPKFFFKFLYNLFYASVVDPFYKNNFDVPPNENEPITITTEKNAYGTKVVSINIYDGKVKYDTLQRFIKKYRQEIFSEVVNIPEFKYAKKSKRKDTRKRDLRIYELMKSQMKAEKVADKISREFSEADCDYDLDVSAIRTAYRTISGEINFLFGPKDIPKRIRRKTIIKKRKNP